MNAPIIIEMSKFSLYLIISGSVIFIIIGFWMFIKSKDQTKYPPSIIRGTAIFIILFFMICSGYGLFGITDNNRKLIIDDSGIRDNTRTTSGVSIRWNNITRFEILEIQGIRSIEIFVDNPDEIIGQESGIQKKLMTVNHRVYGTPLIISCVALKCDIDEILRIMNKELINHRGARQSRKKIRACSLTCNRLKRFSILYADTGMHYSAIALG